MALVERTIELPGEADIDGDSQGVLHCSEHSEAWCNHIAFVVDKGLDSKLIWIPDEYLEEDLDISLDVPVVPTAGTWVKAHLIYRQKLDAMEVYFNFTAVEFAGFIHRGEGRKVLRSMFIDFFRGRWPDDDKKCMSSSHTFQREQELRKLMLTTQNTFANMIELVLRSQCLACRLAYESIFSDPDLVPSDDKKTIWSKG